MPGTISPSSTIAARSSRVRAGGAARPAPGIHARRQTRERSALARYVDERGRTREVIALSGLQGSALVVDRDAATLGDRRLVAHLAADEPSENAALVAASYLDRARRGGCLCRALTDADLRTVPFPDEDHRVPSADPAATPAEPVDRLGGTYRLRPLPTGMSIPELRWRRRSPEPDVAER